MNTMKEQIEPRKPLIKEPIKPVIPVNPTKPILPEPPSRKPGQQIL